MFFLLVGKKLKPFDIYCKNAVFSVRMVRRFFVYLYFALKYSLGYFCILVGSFLEYQLIFDRKCRLCAYMLNFDLVIIAKIIEAQAVFFFVYFVGKLLF